MKNHREHGRDLIAPKRFHSRAAETSWRMVLLVAGLVVLVGLAAMHYLPRRDPVPAEPVPAVKAGPGHPESLPELVGARPLAALRQACVEEVRSKGSGHACRAYEERTRSETDRDINVVTFVPPPSLPTTPARKSSRKHNPSRDWMHAVEHYCDVFSYGSIKYRNCRAHDASRWIKGKCRLFSEELESARGEVWRQQLWADREAACSAANRFNPVN